jgi:hypothetical protein
VSRTDVHRPWWVQSKDPYNRHLVGQYGEVDGEPWILPYTNMTCGCRGCTGKDWRRQERRKSRQQAKKDIGRQLKEM